MEYWFKEKLEIGDYSVYYCVKTAEGDDECITVCQYVCRPNNSYSKNVIEYRENGVVRDEFLSLIKHDGTYDLTWLLESCDRPECIN